MPHCQYGTGQWTPSTAAGRHACKAHRTYFSTPLEYKCDVDSHVCQACRARHVPTYVDSHMTGAQQLHYSTVSPIAPKRLTINQLHRSQVHEDLAVLNALCVERNPGALRVGARPGGDEQRVLPVRASSRLSTASGKYLRALTVVLMWLYLLHLQTAACVVRQARTAGDGWLGLRSAS
jgi:hypothetical protein